VIVVGKGDSGVKKERVQQLNSTDEELCREWRWRTENKKQKTR
jgi:hypothetical protein